MSTPQLPPLGLYIHLPWCERKCPYCDFNSHETAELPEGVYIDALLADLRCDLELAQGRAVETLFIGGGTPSLFSASAISRLLRGIAAMLPLSPGLEATMEANPGSAEAGKFQGFREAGINRLSLGIQSFDDSKLQALGRIHSAGQAQRAIELAREAGFDNINIDLMHGLPGQSASDAINDLKTATEFQTTHLSWYQLTIEPNTRFYKCPPQLPEEDTLADIQQRGEQLLATAGFAQYEVSAYSQPGFNCLHNRNYWSFGDYLGIGAGAHGKITGDDGCITRYAKTRQPEDYMRGELAGRTCSSRKLDRDEIAGEFMLNTLRLNGGFSMAQFSARTGLDSSVLQAQLRRLHEQGLLETVGDWTRASELGRRFLDSVVGEFFND